MGCGGSRPEPDDEVPPGLRPFWRRIQELKRSRMEDPLRRRRERKNSVVSTAELIHPVEANAIEEKSDGMAEEVPGSPSFRFYLNDAGKGGHESPVRGNHQEKLSESKELTNESR
ncbi:hypothetical protein IEQ34_009724 [Dendrobium chrysotoxum]|uniref:Uncharacterized protein n=1 Tax=Dendrobium chrysotoxum TaxID=161865 RepID=A0AAV7GK36_DENCH|nr:hypothetical protein IEQ34_009724 [Dendrobium chrysotoxum]